MIIKCRWSGRGLGRLRAELQTAKQSYICSLKSSHILHYKTKKKNHRGMRGMGGRTGGEEWIPTEWVCTTWKQVVEVAAVKGGGGR